MASYRLPTRNGLVGEWKLDWNALDTAWTNNGTATNVTYATTDRGYQSQCGVFNGTSAKVSVADSTALDLVGTSASWLAEFTISTTGTEKIIVHKESGNPSYGGWVFLVDSTNVLWMRVRDSSNGNDNVLSSTTLTAWKSYFASATYDGANIRIYLNGELIKTQAVTRSIWATSLSMGIGSAAAGGSYMNGKIQSVRIFNRVLSASEIRDYYLEGLRQLGGASLYPLMDGAVAYYDFRGWAEDIIGGLNGTVSGATLTTDRFGNSNGAYSFDGVNDKIDLPSASATKPTAPFTASFHVKTSYSSASTQQVFVQSYSQVSTVAGFQVMQTVPTHGTAPNRIRFVVGANTGFTIPTQYQECFGPAVVNDGAWHRIDCVYSGTQLIVYQDWVAGTAASYSAWIAYTATSYQRIGCANRNASDDSFITGDMSEVLIASSKSAAEVKALYELASKQKLLPFS